MFILLVCNSQHVAKTRIGNEMSTRFIGYPSVQSNLMASIWNFGPLCHAAES